MTIAHGSSYSFSPSFFENEKVKSLTPKRESRSPEKVKSTVLRDFNKRSLYVETVSPPLPRVTKQDKILTEQEPQVSEQEAARNREAIAGLLGIRRVK